MGKLQDQLAEDRELRDTALGLLKGDIDHVRSELDRKGVGARVADTAGEKAMDAIDDAATLAGNHRIALAAAAGATAGAALLWFTRKPLLRLLGSLLEDESEAPGDLDEEEVG